MKPEEPITQVSLQDALAQLYAAEINCGVSCFWDGGWDAWIGDQMNGYKSMSSFERADLASVGSWLLSEAARLYPMFAWREEHVEPHLAAAMQEPAPVRYTHPPGAWVMALLPFVPRRWGERLAAPLDVTERVSQRGVECAASQLFLDPKPMVQALAAHLGADPCIGWMIRVVPETVSVRLDVWQRKPQQ